MWNGAVGDAWVGYASHYDSLLEPFGRAAMDRLDLRPGDRVLDLGCGTGATTLALADLVGSGSVLGVDISARMLAGARARAADAAVDSVAFRQVDVQTGDLGRAEFDAAFSRLGVMFYGDPVAAFTNIAGALVPGGRLGFVCFQEPSANPFIVLPVLAVSEILGLPSFGAPNDPGPFSLADPDGTTALLVASGFADVEISSGPDHAVVTGADDLRMVARRTIEQNPLTSRRLFEVDDATRAAAFDAVATALDPYRDGEVVRLGAGSWVVSARMPT